MSWLQVMMVALGCPVLLACMLLPCWALAIATLYGIGLVVTYWNRRADR
jgi:hypothetical protein